MEIKFDSSSNLIKTISKNNDSYPSLLKEISAPPSKIFLLGSLPENKEIKIAIVGTRKATGTGKIIAQKLAAELSSLGIIIVSGLAMGIDSSAHQGALDAGGKTIAVLANGLDKIYPAQNKNLAKKILEYKGALVSEYPPGTPPYPNQFLERNRIISGLCQAIIVIEAPDRSGSLATARHALEQGREVFIIPGPIDHPNYSGSHKLIRDGARLITSAENIFEDLGLENLKPGRPSLKNLLEKINIKDKNQIAILTALSNSAVPLNIDKICELTKLSSQTANQSLAVLVILEIIKETERGYAI